MRLVIGNCIMIQCTLPTCYNVINYLMINSIVTNPYLPYIPHLAPAGYFLFPNVKSSKSSISKDAIKFLVPSKKLACVPRGYLEYGYKGAF